MNLKEVRLRLSGPYGPGQYRLFNLDRTEIPGQVSGVMYGVYAVGSSPILKKMRNWKPSS